MVLIDSVDDFPLINLYLYHYYIMELYLLFSYVSIKQVFPTPLFPNVITILYKLKNYIGFFLPVIYVTSTP